MNPDLIRRKLRILSYTKNFVYYSGIVETKRGLKQLVLIA